jgi:general secretion pathway protein A
MYKHFFGLRENPFNANPDPRYLFLTPQTQEALDELTYGIHTRKGLILLTGEVGTGKTTLINSLLDWLRLQQTPSAFIFNSHLGISHLFDFILADFGVHFDSRTNSNALMLLNQWLFERYRAGETPVVIVDEAQGLPTPVLEEIRMLLNLETSREKLLQIVLVGQPELEERLRRPELRQIKQRIALRCKTAALNLQEAHDYIQARLHIAGANGKPIFASQAMDAVHFYSRGIPRVMNLLCEHALINAYVDHVQPVPMHIVAEVAREFQFDDIKPAPLTMDSRGAINSNLIDMQSILMTASASPPLAAEPPYKEPPCALRILDSVPFALLHNALSPIKNSAAPSLDCEEIPVQKEHIETSKPLGAPVAGADAPGPKRIAAGQHSGLTAFLADTGIQRTSRLATKPAPLALPTPIHEIDAKEGLDLLRAFNHPRVSDPQRASHPPAKVDATKWAPPHPNLLKIAAFRLFLARGSATWRNRFFPKVTPTDHSRGIGVLLQRSKQSLHKILALYRVCLARRDRCLTMLRAIDWPQTKVSAYRWLRQPWNPTQWRLPDLQVFDPRRRLGPKQRDASRRYEA